MNKYFVESIDGGQLAVYEYGNHAGKALIFLHGFATSHLVWFQQYSDKRLLSSYRIICVDLRGHGQSLLPNSDFSENALWAADLVSIIEQRNINHPCVVAWSYGARMINDYLLKYGQRDIAAVCYVAGASFNDLTAVGPAHQILANMCSIENDIEYACKVFLEKIFSCISNDENYPTIKNEIEKIPVSVKFKLRNRALIYDELFAKLTLPVLAIHGKNDTFLFPKLSEKIASTVKNGEFLLFNSSGHAPFIDEPNRFNTELMNFFE